MTSVRDATSSDLPTAARVLAGAFDEYPWTRWSIPSDGYRERLEELQRIYLGHALEHGLVLVDEGQLGVVALLAPDAPEPSAETQTRIAHLLGDRLERLITADLPPRPDGAWDLATVGVHPDAWGNGVASGLLREALRRLDELEQPVSLETSDPRNVTLYTRHGFEVTATTQVPDGPVVYSMTRQIAG